MRDFVLVSSINLKRFNTKERYIIALDTLKENIISIAKVVKYSSFDETKNDFCVVTQTSETIYLPKVLYKNKNGVYYKIGSEKFYLDENEMQKLNLFIVESINYLQNHNCIPYNFDMIEKN